MPTVSTDVQLAQRDPIRLSVVHLLLIFLDKNCRWTLHFIGGRIFTQAKYTAM